MSGRRPNAQDVSLCRFTFADGRRCRLPARPDFDGLCFQHGTFRPRASRQDNFLREIQPLAQGSCRQRDIHRAQRALSRASEEHRISPEAVGDFDRLASLIRLSGRYAQEEQFAAGLGHDWDAIRKLLDDPDDSASSTDNISSTKVQR